MGREQDSFEWVNAWADATGKLADAALPDATAAEVHAEASGQPAAKPVQPAKPAQHAKPAQPAKPAQAAPQQCVIARIAATMPADQLMRDILEIERARDALALLPVSGTLRVRTQALTLVAPRTTDPVPVVIGGVFALVMLTVFGAAAAMTKLSR